RKKENTLNAGRSKMQVYESNIDELTNRKRTLKDNEESAEQNFSKLKPLQQQLDETLSELESGQTQKMEALSERDGERSIAQERNQKAQLKRQNLKNEVGNHERELTRAKDGIINLKNRTEKRTQKRKDVKERIKTNKRHIKTLNEKI